MLLSTVWGAKTWNYYSDALIAFHFTVSINGPNQNEDWRLQPTKSCLNFFVFRPILLQVILFDAGLFWTRRCCNKNKDIYTIIIIIRPNGATFLSIIYIYDLYVPLCLLICLSLLHKINHSKVELVGKAKTGKFWAEIWQEGWLSTTERASVSAVSLRHILASPGYASGTIAVNVTWLEREFNAGHMSIYRQQFTSYSEILVGNCNFSYLLHLTPPLGCSHWNSGKTWSPVN